MTNGMDKVKLKFIQPEGIYYYYNLDAQVGDIIAGEESMPIQKLP